MRVALARELAGIDSVELGDQPDPAPAAGQALIRVHGAGIGPWDVGFLSGGFPGIALPFVPGQEVAGVVEAVGDGAGVQPGERVYASLFPAGGGFAELALASADRLAPMPSKASFQEAAGLVIGAGTAYEGLVDRGRLQAGETVLITAAAGGVGSAAVQIAAAIGRPHPRRGQPAQPRLPARPGGQRGLRLQRRRLGRAGACRGSRRRRPAARLRRRPDPRPSHRCRPRRRPGDFHRLAGLPAQLERGITGESFAAHGARQRLEALRRLVDTGKLRPQVEAVLPLDQAREALARVASRHTRGKIVLHIGP